MHTATYLKPDGRKLWLYGRGPIAPIAQADIPSPLGGRVPVNSHMRRHPLTQEWVVYAAHRQDRTFLPSAAENPLAPTADASHPTEIPQGDYDVAVFENRFPSLAKETGPPPDIVGIATHPAFGACEVVVFSKDPHAGLSMLPADHIRLVLDVLAARTKIMREAGMSYVLPFENRGREMGVTLHHPHAQIYGYGFIPQQQARALQGMRAYYHEHGADLLSSMAVAERADGTRLVASSDGMVAFTPAFARFPYEVWIAPTRPAPFLADLTDAEREEMADLLRETLRRMDRLWDVPMPYLLTINQAPTDGGTYPEWTVRIEICPIRRARDKLKYLAGTELGTGVFAGDVLPEASAQALRAVIL